MDARWPFVGRGAELELLLDRLAAAGAGRGGVVLVSGPAGIGKTWLVEEALTRGRGTAAVARAQCWDGSGAPPLWPWTRVAARLALELAAALTSGAALTAAAASTGGAGAAGGAGPAGGAEPAVLAAERFRMLTAATDALLRAAAERPLVVVLEDVHWADSESLELLRRISAEIDGTGLLVVATHRDEPAGVVGAAVADIRRGPATTAVGLAPLSPREVADYLRAVDAPADADRVSRLHRGTGGLPLLVAAASGTDGAAGTDVRAVVAGLLARLTPGRRRVLDAVAVVGTTADPELLAEVSEVDTAAVADALTGGRLAGLLGPGDDGPGFSHALVRDEVRRAVPPAAAAALHRRAAAALETRAATRPALAGEVAAHWRHAGADPEAARRAADWAVRAAGQAGSALALDDACAHLRDAVGSLAAAGATDAEQADLLVRLATACFLAGRMDASVAACEAAARAATRAGRPDLVAAAALVVRGVTYPAASATVRRLGRAALAAPLPDGVRARLFAQLATVDSYDGRTAEAERAAGEALRLATAAGDPQAVLDAVRAAEGNLLNASASAERLRLGELALEQAERLGQPLAAVLGAGWQVRGAYELGRLDLVDAAIAEMERVADASGLPVARWHAQRARAARAMLEGRFAAARQANAAALELAVASGDVVAVGMTFAAANHLAHLRGDPAEFLGGEEEQLAAAPPMPLIRTSRALMLLVLGRRDEAHAVYEELRAGLGSYPLDYRWVPSWCTWPTWRSSSRTWRSPTSWRPASGSPPSARGPAAPPPPTSSARPTASWAGWPRWPAGSTRPRPCSAAPSTSTSGSGPGRTSCWPGSTSPACCTGAGRSTRRPP